MKALLHPPTTEVKNIGIWIRVSTEEQAHGDAPEHHHLELAKLCRIKRLERSGDLRPCRPIRQSSHVTPGSETDDGRREARPHQRARF
jgi:hypothetical protein